MALATTGATGLQKVRHVMQEVSHWLLEGTMVAEGETDGAGRETLDAGGNHGMQKVRQMVQEVRHWMLEGTMGRRR